MKTSLYVAALCVSTALSPVAFAQMGSGQMMGGQSGQQMGQQQPMMGQQQQMGGQQQMPQQSMNQGQRLTDQGIRQFFGNVQQVLQRAARTQDPALLRQYMNQYMEPEAEITTSSELYVGDRHVATTIAHSSEEVVAEALGHAASALQGRKLVSDYNIDLRVRDIEMMPGQQAARVAVVIQESGNFAGPIAARVAERMRERGGGQQHARGWGRQQQGGQQGGQQGAMSGSGQSSDDDGQQQQERSLGIGAGQGRGGGMDQQGIHFENRSTCLINVELDDGQMRIGNSFCRGLMRLG